MRDNFIFDSSLVLYLPLYQLDGASFMSRDAYGHLCTVTGALWTPRGRTFDGDDDRIASSSSSAFAAVTGITIMIWCKITTQAAVNTLAQIGSGDNFRAVFNLNQNGAGDASAGNIRVHIRTTPTGAVGVGTTVPPLSNDTWAFVTLRYDKINLEGWVNNEQKCTLARTESLTGDDPAICYIGATDTLTNDTTGTVGEVLIYNRALTPQEIQHNYLSTRWRYQ